MSCVRCPEIRRRAARVIGWSLGLLAAFAVSNHAAAQAVIEGRVKLSDARTAPVVKKRYEIVSKAGVVAISPPLAVVYLEGNFPRPREVPVIQLAQKDLAFATALLPVQVGTRVEFPNHDDTYHNIFSYSAPKRFDLGRYRSDERPIPSQVFDVPGMVTLRCDIHEHMRAIVLVLDTPYFVVTEPDGSFRLTGLPAGWFTLKAWLNSRTTLSQPIEIAPDAQLTVELQ